MFKNKIHSREDLKKFFRNGGIPTENHFSNLIDSMINKQDDGLSKDDDNGLILSSRGNSKKLITLYKNMDDLNPFFYLEKDEQEIDGLRFTPAEDQDENIKEQNSFFFHVNGSLGVGTRSNKDYKLEVDGFAAMEGRVGTFVQGQIPADGHWHTIVDHLDNCQAFEVVARTGKKGFGKFAILHAYALSAFGKSNSRIRRTCAYYGFFWNKIGIRWKSINTHDYALQVRTNCNYGRDISIHYKVTRLWDDEKFLNDNHYYS
ncbi:adhesin [Pedobacter sp. L105]|uniref:adhesin n=1 Tax=Pedobacter sp. L105 TaxID=1641871 RepID=UPI00131D1918|nr:adhesin [Pedobacter sp. L105]